MKTCIIVGGGKSFREGLEKNFWQRINGMDWWSLNYSFMFADILPSRQIFVDDKFYRSNKEELWKLAVQDKVPIYCKEHIIYHNEKFPTKEIWKSSRGVWYDKEQMIKEHSLSTSIMQMNGEFSLSLAIVEGYERVFLMGYDAGVQNPLDKDTHWYQKGFKNSKERQWWFNDIKKFFSTGVGNPSTYWEFSKNPKTPPKLKEDIAFYHNYNKANIEIYNVSLISNIDSFPKISYDEFFDMIEK